MQERRANKELEKERIKEEMIKAAGPSAREEELKVINDVLKKDSLRVKEILSDGNCLYRSVDSALPILALFSIASRRYLLFKLNSECQLE